MPVRELVCLRLGTPMGTPVDQTDIYEVFWNPSAYDAILPFVKGRAKLRCFLDFFACDRGHCFPRGQVNGVCDEL